MWKTLHFRLKNGHTSIWRWCNSIKERKSKTEVSAFDFRSTRGENLRKPVVRCPVSLNEEKKQELSATRARKNALSLPRRGRRKIRIGNRKCDVSARVTKTSHCVYLSTLLTSYLVKIAFHFDFLYEDITFLAQFWNLLSITAVA